MEHKPGILTLDVGTGTKDTHISEVNNLNISVKIPRQTLVLQNVLVKGYEQTSPAIDGKQSLSDLGVLYVEIKTDQGNLFSYNLMVDNNVGRTNIPIMVNNASSTFVANTLQLPVYTSTDVPHYIQSVRLLDKNGVETSKVSRLVLQFSYQGLY